VVASRARAIPVYLFLFF